MADDRDRDAGGSGARRALPGEGTGMSGVVELAEQLAVAVKALREHQRAFDAIESAIHELDDADALDAIVGIVNETRDAV
jgi:hypothetical protein